MFAIHNRRKVVTERDAVEKVVQQGTKFSSKTGETETREDKRKSRLPANMRTGRVFFSWPVCFAPMERSQARSAARLRHAV